MNSVNFSGNDYLGMSSDKRVAKAMCQACEKYGISVGAGRWSIGWSELHQQLENELSAFFGQEDTAIHGSAYLCGSVFFSAVSGEYDTAFYDENCHANLILGMRASGFILLPYRHLDVDDLEMKLSAYHGSAPVIVTDGIFGISGEVAPIREICELAEAKKALTFIDDAHGVFAVGSNGRGTTELCGICSSEVLLMGSMSKALGVYGGFVSGSRKIVDKIRRTVHYVGSTPSPYPIVAACLEALRILRHEPERRQVMKETNMRMRIIVAESRIPVLSDPRVPIVTMILKDRSEAERLAAMLNRRGLLVRYLDYPSEPRKNLLRTIARPVYTEAHFQCLAEILKGIEKE